MADKSPREFQRLKQASRRNQCHLAIALGRKYCQRYPDHAPAWLFYGRSLMQASRFEESRTALMNCLKCAAEARHATIINNMGHEAWFAGDFERAEALYRKAFDLTPPDSEERLHLGDILLRRAKFAEAEEVLRIVTSSWNESMGEAWHLLGEALASQERYAEALDCFERAAEAAPDRRKHARRVRELTRLAKLD